MKKHIRLASRASALALTQAEIVKAKLYQVYPDLVVTVVPISTHGDVDKVSSLSEIGGKGVFVKEIQQALLDGDADIAVHSLKDVTSTPPNTLVISGFLRPESIVDTVLSADGISFQDFKQNAIIATGSLRRRALLKRLRPDIQFVDIRGNIETRIQRLSSGDFDGLMLSKVGLIRLGITDTPHSDMDPASFYPAPGQGVIALEVRDTDTNALSVVNAISDAEQGVISGIDLDILRGLAFNCSIPLGTYTRVADDYIHTLGFVENPDTTEFKEFDFKTPINDRKRHVQQIVEECKQVLSNG